MVGVDRDGGTGTATLHEGILFGVGFMVGLRFLTWSLAQNGRKLIIIYQFTTILRDQRMHLLLFSQARLLLMHTLRILHGRLILLFISRLHLHEVLKLVEQLELLLRLVWFLVILASILRWELERLIAAWLLFHLLCKGGNHVLDIDLVARILSALGVATHGWDHIVEEFDYPLLVESLVRLVPNNHLISAIEAVLGARGGRLLDKLLELLTV